MSFIALPADAEGKPLHRRTYGSAICETYEDAETWSKAYIERRLEQRKGAKGRKLKRVERSFARLHQVIILEQQGNVIVPK